MHEHTGTSRSAHTRVTSPVETGISAYELLKEGRLGHVLIERARMLAKASGTQELPGSVRIVTQQLRTSAAKDTEVRR
ncbi:MAG: hypothetical protein H6815_01325 [Phycisphaeraceae bacterium]|nr:hypothetical protein [Phycisphaerales bacterium]MCB9859068.1 hypothetical protein [Phycisphaeraceae bacterium]